jgi:hypothetical protein
MNRQKKKRLSQQDLRTLGATPGLILHKVSPDGRARLEQLTAEASSRPLASLVRRSAANDSVEDSGGE